MEQLNYRNKLIVKSNTLIESKYHLSVREQKFLIYLASLVKKDDLDYKYTSVKIKDIEAALKVGSDKKWGSIYEVVREIVLNINSKPISLRKPNGGWTIINWFSAVDADPSQGVVTFELSEGIKKQLVRLNEYFTKYRFGNILTLKSGYSIRIYELLKLNEFKNKVTYDLDYFRELIGVSYLDENQKWVHKYSEYKAFKRSIIKHAQKELKQETDIYFELKETRENRKVKSLTFYVFKNKAKKKSNQSELFANKTPVVVEEDTQDYNALIVKAFIALGLNETKAKQVYTEGFNFIDDEKVRKAIVKEDRALDEYFLEKIDYVNLHIEKGNLDNPAGLLIKAIKENYYSKALTKRKKAILDKDKRKDQEVLQAQQEKALRDLQQKLVKKEMKKVMELVNSSDTFLEDLLTHDNPDLWSGYKNEHTLKENFLAPCSQMFKFKIIDKIKTRYPEHFVDLNKELEEIRSLKKKL